jgi:hypothetical protein
MSKLIGNNSNQVPLNSDLGTMAYQDSASVRAGEMVISKPYSIYQSDAGGMFPSSSWPTYQTSNRIGEEIGKGKVARISTGHAQHFSNDAFGGATKMLIQGIRYAPSSGGTGAYSGTPIAIAKFHYKSPYRGMVDTRIRYAISSDGAYSSLSGELYFQHRNYNSSVSINKTNSIATTLNRLANNSSTSIHYHEYLYLDVESTGDNSETYATLYTYGTGSQWGSYHIPFTLEITTFATSDSGLQYGIKDFVYEQYPYS